MIKKDLLYEGKAKKIYSTDEEDKVIIYYKDDATAFNGVKKSTILNKGVINNHITSIIYKKLMNEGIKTHFIELLNDREQLCHKLKIFKLEVILRNVIAGSIAKRLGIEEGSIPSNTIYELCYKNDEYNDPIINEDHAIILDLATETQLNKIKELGLKINEVLKSIFNEVGIILVDLKLEFGLNNEGEIMLADEISPDTCRLWDQETNEKLDKDRFRRDLGKVENAYMDILNRLRG